MAEKPKKSVCLTQGCKEVSITRGLCRKCYASAQQAVKKGDVTLDQLVELGLMNPSLRLTGVPSPFAACLKEKLGQCGVVRVAIDDRGTDAPALPWKAKGSKPK